MSVDSVSSVPNANDSVSNEQSFNSAVDKAKDQDANALLEQTIMQGMTSVGMGYLQQYINETKKQMKPPEE